MEAYNGRGEVLLALIARHLETVADLTLGALTATRLDLTINEPARIYTEEERSKKPTVFTVLRAVTGLFHSARMRASAFTAPSATTLPSSSMRSIQAHAGRRTSVTWFSSCRDEILVVDHYSAKAWIDRYDFAKDGETTVGKAGEIAANPSAPSTAFPAWRSSPRRICRAGRQGQGELPTRRSVRGGAGQKFYERCESRPSEISNRLKAINPSPYSFFINLGNQE